MEYLFRTILHGSLSFSVDCANDAHIALTTKAKASDPIIEIYLGGWKNTASALRYNQQTPDKVLNVLPLCFDDQFYSHTNIIKYIIFTINAPA